MLCRLLSRSVALSVMVLVAAPGFAEASTGQITVDRQSGEVHWTSTESCTPGTEVEVDLYVAQNGDEAFASVIEPCPSSGQLVLTAQSYIVDGSEPLHPGRATLSIHRREHIYDPEGHYEGPVPSEPVVLGVVLRPL